MFPQHSEAHQFMAVFLSLPTLMLQYENKLLEAQKPIHALGG